MGSTYKLALLGFWILNFDFGFLTLTVIATGGDDASQWEDLADWPRWDFGF